MPPASHVLTLLPTALQVEQEADARLHVAGVLGGAAVRTLSTFERRLADELLGPGATASELAARLLVGRVLAEACAADGTRYFAPLARSGRFAERLRDLFGQFARGLVTPARLAALAPPPLATLPPPRLAAAAPPAGDGRLARKLADLARLYGAYESRLETIGRVDPASRRRRLVEALGARATPPALLAGIDRIVAADRDRWLPADAALLAAVARFVPVEVHLAAPVRGRERLFALVTRSEAVLAAAARAAGARLAVVRERPCGGPGTAPALEALCSRLFAPADTPLAGPVPEAASALAFVEAPGRVEEVDATVREVRRALEAGTRPDQVAIVTRSLDRYGPLLARALERARVPFRFRRGVPLADAPVARATLALLTLPLRRFDLDGTLGVFGGSYTRLPGVSPAALERTLNRARLLEGTPERYAAALEALVAALEAEGRRAEAGEARRVREALVPALGAVAALEREGTLAEHVDRTCRLLEATGLAAVALSGDEGRQRQDAAALAGLGAALDAVRLAGAELGDGGAVTFRAFLDLLGAALAERFVEPPGSRPVEAVRVLAATDVGGLGFEVVCLLGLVEGEFPRHPPPNPMLLEREVEALALALAGLAPFETPAEMRAAEPFYLFRVTAAARRRLVLSVPAEDLDGSPLLHSSFLEEVARALDPDARARHPKGDPLAALRAPGIGTRLARRPVPERFADCLTAAEAEARLAWLEAGLPAVARRRHLEAAADAVVAAPLEAALAGDPGAAARLAARRQGGRVAALRDRFFAEVPGPARTALVGPGTGALETAAARAALRAALTVGGEVHLSASALESHALCAYQWLLGHGVGLGPVERPRPDLEAREGGTLLHAALECGYRACHEAALVPIGGRHDPGGGAAEAIMLAAAEQVLAGWDHVRHDIPEPVREAEAARIRLLVRAFVRDEATRAAQGYVPVAFEHAFGPRRDGRPPAASPVRIPLSSGATVALRGSVDRIDWAPATGRLRVVDYKRSTDARGYRARLEPAALGAWSFQAPVYLLAAEALRAARPDLFPGAALSGREAAYHLLGRRPEFCARALDDAGYFALDPATRAARRAAGAPAFADLLEARLQRLLEGPYEITPDPEDTCERCDFGRVCRVVHPLPVALP